MFRAILSATVMLALLAAGCAGSSDGHGAEGRLTAAELGWLRAYSEWSIAIYYDELEPSAGQSLVEACTKMHDDIGEAPTDRLERPAALAPDVCPLLEKAGRHRRALDRIEEMDALLLPLLRDEQPLVLARGVSDASRADEALSAYATRAVGKPIEVRCWDVAEWRRVVHEDNAWNDDTKDPDDLSGWADDESGRIHMQLEDCNALSRLIESGAVSDSPGDRVDFAWALETLAHEAQHFRLDDGSEAEVECAAMRSIPRAGKFFGLSAEDAAQLAVVYRREIYPDLPAEYREGGCPP